MKKINSTPPLKIEYFAKGSFKKALTLSFFLLPGFFCMSQSIDFGLRGGISSAWLLNSNVSSGKDFQHYEFAISDNYGVHGAINFRHGYGLELDILEAKINQAYGGVFNNSGEFPGIGVTYNSGQTYSAETQISVLKIPVLFRYEHELTGKYLEAGMAYEVINGGTYSSTYKSPAQVVDYNISSQLPNGNFLAILGLGWDKRVSHDGSFYLNFGFRLEYGLFDLMGVDGHGQDITGPKSVILYEQPNPYYKSYSATHSLECSFNMGLFYRIFPKSMIHKRVIDF